LFVCYTNKIAWKAERSLGQSQGRRKRHARRPRPQGFARACGRVPHTPPQCARDAQRRPRRLEARPLGEANEWLEGYRDFWEGTFQRLDDVRRELRIGGELLADVIPPQVVTTLAVIEQTDDRDYVEKQGLAFEEVLSQYGLKDEEAYRYSVSSAKALGPMQFTNRRGNGTYSLVVRRCRGANLDPKFESGATNLLNAMKAAVCLLDMEIAGMRDEDFEVAFENNILMISGTRLDLNERRAYHQMEIRFGKFEIAVELPMVVDIEKATAGYQDGFLVVVLPKVKSNKGEVE